MYETEMHVPGLQAKHSTSHSFLPFRKHGCIAVISSVNLHLRLAIFNSKKLQSLIFSTKILTVKTLRLDFIKCIIQNPGHLSNF